MSATSLSHTTTTKEATPMSDELNEDGYPCEEEVITVVTDLDGVIYYVGGA